MALLLYSWKLLSLNVLGVTHPEQMENMEEDIQVKECKKFIGAKVIAGYWIVIAGYWIAKQKTRITTQRLWKSSETNPHQGLWKYSENPFQWHNVSSRVKQ